MTKVSEFKEFLDVPFVWPGSHVKYMVCADGACLCHKCAKANAEQIVEATDTVKDDQWRFVGADVNWEDVDLYCAHCNGHIEPEYGDD